MSVPMLQAEHITSGYFHRVVVRDVSFSVSAGEFCALLGLNGCGKSTLIKAICGLLPGHGGRCLVDGEDCSTFHERQRALRMAYIPQRGSLIEGKTVLEVVLMGFNARLHLLESPGEQHRESALATLERLGLSGFAQRDYATLSEGQKQLVILARALVQDTPVMLMDEPDSALDFVNRSMVLGKIQEILHSQRRAGLITLHDPNFALRYCDRLLLMRQGEICREISLAQTTQAEIEAALSEIYGDIRIIEYQGGFVMVHK